MNFKSFGVGLFMVLSIFGCGKESNNSRSNSWSEYLKGGTPIPLFKEVKNCNKEFNPENDSHIYIFRYRNGTSNLVELNFLNQIQSSFILSEKQGPLVKSIYGSEISYELTNKYYEELGGYFPVSMTDYSFSKKGKKLDICPGLDSYDKKSYENAGLSISYTITKTYNKVKEVYPKLDLGQLTLYVAPIISVTESFHGGEKNKQKETRIDTDNAFYNGQKKMIAFLPESEERKFVAPLWEIPMVAAHEYGHHIFNVLVNSKIGSKSELIGNCFNGHKREDLQLSQGKFRDIRPQAFTLRAINEGFADLIAYYTNEDHERGLKGVRCFEKNREVSSEIYGDGTKKYFSAKAKEVMDSMVAIEADRDCNTPNFQKIHEAGASFAYMANHMIAKVTSDKDLKLKLLLFWGNYLSQFHSKLEKARPSTYMQASMEILVLLINSLITEDANKFSCSVIGEYIDMEGKSCLLITRENENAQSVDDFKLRNFIKIK